jgi:hypothetical protein
MLTFTSLCGLVAPDLLLQTLDLCCNQIMRPGTLAVARALAGRAKAGSSKLALLALDENAISEAGVEQLRALLTVSGWRSKAGRGGCPGLCWQHKCSDVQGCSYPLLRWCDVDAVLAALVCCILLMTAAQHSCSVPT